jgi:hypothetical protein
MFHTYEDFQNAPELTFAIKGWLQADGITMIGGLAGHGKTLVGLSTVKALLTGEPLFGHEPFEVNRSKRVIYLCPEVGMSPLVHRLKLFRLDRFVEEGTLLYRSLSSEPVPITDERLLRAAEGADVFLDTAVRFMDGDENGVQEQRVFATNLFALIKAGARTVTGLHHSPKAFEKVEFMTLENALRGSGDVGAMLSTAWAVRMTEPLTTELYIKNVKPRDFEPCQPFSLTGRPYLDETGDFKMSSAPGLAMRPKATGGRPQADREAIVALLDAGKKPADIAEELQISTRTVQRVAEKWTKP